MLFFSLFLAQTLFFWVQGENKKKLHSPQNCFSFSFVLTFNRTRMRFFTAGRKERKNERKREKKSVCVNPKPPAQSPQKNSFVRMKQRLNWAEKRRPKSWPNFSPVWRQSERALSHRLFVKVFPLQWILCAPTFLTLISPDSRVLFRVCQKKSRQNRNFGQEIGDEETTIIVLCHPISSPA